MWDPGLWSSLAGTVYQAAAQTQPLLNLTAIVTDASNNSALECWEFSNPFTTFSTGGTVGALVLALGNVTSAAYTVLSPRFEGGIHNAPRPQLVHYVSGLAHISLPTNSSSDAWLLGGPAGLLIAADTTGSGHRTTYPSDESTVAVVLPFEGGKLPDHRVVRSEACLSDLGNL